jgi:hypothetical protein
LRILARSVQLQPLSTGSMTALRNTVAYGGHVDEDPVLVEEADRGLAWRGVLLRHESVGAWRRLWARLVGHVVEGDGSLTREDLHDWISNEVPGVTVHAFRTQAPPICDDVGNPLPAEERVRANDDSVSSDLAVLLLGAARVSQLQGRAAQAFLGRAGGQGQWHCCIKRSAHPIWSTCSPRSHVAGVRMPGLLRFSKVPEGSASPFWCEAGRPSP